MAIELNVTEDHPLALELASLRTAVARYQHEAHVASVKLQRHSLDTTHALEGARLLEQENQRLTEEVALLRAIPDTTPHPASLQVPELTLALRKLSDKLTLTEETLAARTRELVTAQNALTQAELEIADAQSLALAARQREEEGRARERELEQKAKAANEERKMADLVVQEYADLVRSLEGRSRGPRPSIQVTREASSSSVTLVESLAEGKTGLQKLLVEFNGESERHAADMFHLQGKLEAVDAALESERRNANDLRSQLAAARAEMDKYQTEDNTAAKMVSRYMKFSQTTTDALQKAMDNLKSRHGATVNTLETQIETMQKSLAFERKQSETLRRALDELSEDISREAYGRRREISLRLAFLGREEGLAENLRRWLRKSKESFSRVLSKQPQPVDNSPLVKSFERILHDADRLLESLNGVMPVEDDAAPGSVARILAAQNAVGTLTRELHHETSRRLEAERRLAHYESTDGDPNFDGPPEPSIKEAMVVSPDSLVEKNGILHLADPPKRTVSLLPSPPVPTEPSGGALEPPPKETPPSEQPSPDVPQVEAQRTHYDLQSLQSPAIPATPPNALDIHQLQAVSDTPSSASVVLDAGSSVTPVVSELPSAYTEDREADQTSPPPVQYLSHLNGDVEKTEELTIPSPEEKGLIEDVTALPETIEVVPGIIVAPADVLNTKASTAKKPAEVTELEATTNDLSDLSSSASPLDDGSLSPFKSTANSGQPDSVSPVLPALSIAPSPYRQASPTPDLNTQQRLLAALRATHQRYDGLQRFFRDCDLALKDLRRELASLSDNLEMTMVVQTAVERLRDFNEDARVELEIRISDEERICAGYSTLLSIPGALAEEVDASELENEIQAFVEGTDKGVAKATQQLTRKLEDLQHDIASIKLTVHELASSAEEQQSSPDGQQSQNGWSSWTGGLLGSSRPSSPAPATFGSVMTSPRLRHSPSLSRMSSQRSLTDPDNSNSSHNSPFTNLGLRIPMPAHVLPRRPSTLSASGLGKPAPGGPVRPRVQSASAMYLLGLGGRSGSFSSAGQQRPVVGSPAVRRVSLKSVEVEEEPEAVVESDIE